MCDLTTIFVIVSVVNNKSATLITVSKKYILLLFSIWNLVIIDDSNIFKSILTTTYESLNITYEIVS